MRITEWKKKEKWTRDESGVILISCERGEVRQSGVKINFPSVSRSRMELRTSWRAFGLAELGTFHPFASDGQINARKWRWTLKYTKF